MSHNLYLVPYDFTIVSDAALKYAMHIGKHVKTEIQVVHLVSDKSKIAAAKQKLDAILEGLQKESNVILTSLIEVGSIFTDFGKIAKREYAQLIIMGTHGQVGLQKLFGSHALKVITSTNVPFLVVQEKTELIEIKKIIVPIDLTAESLQITNVAGDLAAIFGAELHVATEKITDPLHSKKLATRIQMIKKQYDDRKLISSVTQLDKGGSFQKKIIDYSKSNQVDLIALAYHTESLLPQFDKFAQTLLTNDLNLPCTIINSKSASSSYF
jgi:nucleotide-binding universal stress UspA family protein